MWDSILRQSSSIATRSSTTTTTKSTMLNFGTSSRPFLRRVAMITDALFSMPAAEQTGFTTCSWSVDKSWFSAKKTLKTEMLLVCKNVLLCKISTLWITTLLAFSRRTRFSSGSTPTSLRKNQSMPQNACKVKRRWVRHFQQSLSCLTVRFRSCWPCRSSPFMSSIKLRACNTIS